MMRKYIKRRTLIITLFLVLFLLVNIVISYSYFIGKVYNNESETTLSLTSNGLKIVYQNDTPIINEEDITSGWVSTKSFSISANAQNNDISLVEPKIWYNMKLIIDENTFSDGVILYSLTNTTTDSNGLAADSFSELSIPTGSNMDGLSLGSGYVELGNNMHTYVLEVKYNASKGAEYNKKFSCHIVTEIVSNVTLSIDLDGGTSTDILEKSLGKQSIVKLSTPTKAGNDFAGWQVVSGDGVINNDSTITVGNVDTKIKAKWTVRTINVHLDLNGGTSTDNVDITAPQDSYIDLATPTKDNYEFEGWELLDGTAEIKGNRIITSKTDIILKTKWNYAVRFITLAIDLNGGTSDTIQLTQTVSANSGVSLDKPVRDGYLFGGWEIVLGDADISNNLIIVREENVILKAKWKEVYPVFTYLKSDGTSANYMIVTENKNDWQIKFLESGTLTFNDLGNAEDGIDVFLVGGGGKGATATLIGGGGGGGGYTVTEKNILVSINENGYEIKIGGSASSTSAFGFVASPGANASGTTGGAGTGRGGAGGDTARVDYGSGSPGGAGGAGVYAFGDSTGSYRYGGGGGGGGGYPYAAGGSGGASGGGQGGNNVGHSVSGESYPGAANSGGGGGGGGGWYGGGSNGGSGIVIIRNARG